MGKIADRWDRLTDEQRVAELRAPGVTQGASRRAASSSKASSADLVEAVGNEVVKLRRAALSVVRPERRSALVDVWLVGFKRRAHRADWPVDLVRTVEAVVRSETTGWKHFGKKTYR